MSFMHGPCGTWYQDLCVCVCKIVRYMMLPFKGLTIRETMMTCNFCISLFHMRQLMVNFVT